MPIAASADDALGSSGTDDAFACVTGDRIYIEVGCVPCRVRNGTVVEGVVSEMTAGQLAYAQNVARIGGPALRSASEWSARIETSAQRRVQ